MKKTIILLGLILTLITSVSSQTDLKTQTIEADISKKQNILKSTTGVLFGKVVDEKTGELLSGISISIDGNNIVSSTDGQGKFLLNLKPGVYTLVFKNISYKTKEEKNIEIKLGAEINLNIVLEPSTNELTGAIVKGKGKKESMSALLIQQKNAIAVSDGISIENIRKTPDRNTADIMKRVSGASIQDGKFAIIRGLNDRYNAAYINGAPLPSTEADKKAFSFDLIPAIMIDNITISKTATPDKTGEFAGGIIEIITRDIPEKKFFQITYGSNYHTISTFKPSQSYAGSNTDMLGYDNGVRKLPSSFPTSADYSKQSIAQQISQSKNLNNDWANQKNNFFGPGNNLSIVGGKPYKIGKKDAGFFCGLTYSNQNRFNRAERNDYDQQGSIFKYTDSAYKSTVLVGLILNNSIKFAPGHKVSFKNTLNINSENQTVIRDGIDYSAGSYVRSFAYIFNQNIFTSSQLSGDHIWSTAKAKLNWNIGYSYINRQMPDYRRLRYFKPTPENQDPDNPQDFWQAYISPSANPNDGGRFYSKLTENIWSGSVNFTQTIKIKTIKFDFKSGVALISRSRNFNARVLGYVTNPKFDYNLLKQDIGHIFSSENMNTNGFRLSESTNPSDQYTASSNLMAAYAMIDQRASAKWRFIYGARIESFQQILHSKDYTNKPIEVNTQKIDFLPSLNVTYAANKKTNFRFGASQTVSRPEFRELAPFGFFDFNQFVSMQGNSKLVRSLIKNYDLRYETFPADGEVLSASAFYKDFTNPIEIVLDPAIGGGTRSMSYANIPKATALGIELEYRKRFPALANARWTKFFTFSTNASYIQSRVNVSNQNASGRKYRPLQGQSPYLLNGSLNFQNKGWSMTASYNVVGPRISNVGTANYLEYYEKPRHLIDFQFSKTFKKDKMDVKLNISDLLAQNLVYYQPNSVAKGTEINLKNTRPINTFYNGRSITLSFGWKF